MSKVCLVVRSMQNSMEVSAFLRDHKIRTFFCSCDEVPSEKLGDFSCIIVTKKYLDDVKYLGDWIFLCMKPVLILGNSVNDFRSISGERFPKNPERNENNEIILGNIVLLEKYDLESLKTTLETFLFSGMYGTLKFC